MTLNTLNLGNELSSSGLHVIGTIFTFTVITVWVCFGPSELTVTGCVDSFAY